MSFICQQFGLISVKRQSQTTVSRGKYKPHPFTTLTHPHSSLKPTHAPVWSVVCQLNEESNDCLLAEQLMAFLKLCYQSEAMSKLLGNKNSEDISPAGVWGCVRGVSVWGEWVCVGGCVRGVSVWGEWVCEGVSVCGWVCECVCGCVREWVSVWCVRSKTSV